jgi:hypothetical protein
MSSLTPLDNFFIESQLTLLECLKDATNCPVKRAEYQKQIDFLINQVKKTLNYDA